MDVCVHAWRMDGWTGVHIYLSIPLCIHACKAPSTRYLVDCGQGFANVILPNAPAINQTKREDEGGSRGVDGGKDRLQIAWGTEQVDMKSGDGQTKDKV